MLAFPKASRSFIRLAEARARDDAFWNDHALPPWLHDNHVFCALLNLHPVEMTLLDAQEFNWPGYHHGGRLQVRRVGSSLVNRETGRPLRLVHFAGAVPLRGSARVKPGSYLLELSLVQEGVRWFHEAEAEAGVRVPLEVRRP